ncbi:MAG: hypothetical protein D3925_12840 [Candidatus Electrothrix sp. AR5]|nr:hypothetical protein [Candidatus Electrothrix sp. AR5]
MGLQLGFKESTLSYTIKGGETGCVPGKIKFAADAARRIFLYLLLSYRSCIERLLFSTSHSSSIMRYADKLGEAVIPTFASRRAKQASGVDFKFKLKGRACFLWGKRGASRFFVC